MNFYYAFNGDADGLCALQQLRLAEPRNVNLVTGVKRDIKLLQRVRAVAGDSVTVLDVSLDQNRADVLRLLDAGVSIRYFDHHYAGELPRDSRFEHHIEETVDVCTSILVDRYLNGGYRLWAIAAAFGDSLSKVGKAMAEAAGLDPHATETLERLGIYLNYNAYGETVNDLHFDPVDLAQQMLPFTLPLDFVSHSPAYARLAAGYQEDMKKARELKPVRSMKGALMFLLPEESWARRVAGVLANDLTRSHPESAIAILSPKTQGGFSVSVRVPTQGSFRADEFCRTFETGGGRKLAAGINHLSNADVDRFAQSFESHFGVR